MMKRFSKEEIMQQELVKSKVWMVFDILRSENISSDNYDVLLFLLSAFKDNVVFPELVNGHQSFKEILIERLRHSNNELSPQYALILQSFEPSIQRLSENGLRHIFSALAEIDKQFLIDNFSYIFDSVLYRISESHGRYAGDFIQPVEITRFMCGLADLKKKSKVFNPFAGIASFGVYLHQWQDYLGQEINFKTAALGILRLMAYKKLDSSKYFCDDSISNWPAQSEKFDLIISNPPFGMRIGNRYPDLDLNIRTVEQFLLKKGVQSLTQNGKLIALLPQGFLFKGLQDQRLRQYLVEEDLIETIISLPSGLLLNTGIPLTILVLSHDKKLPGRVKFVNGTKFLISNGIRDKVLDDYTLLNLVHSNKIDENFVKIVFNEQIRNNDFNLSVARYFQEQIEGVRLGDVLELIRGQRVNLTEIGKLIRIRNLKDDKVDHALDISSIEENELRQTDTQISESCLLLAMRWRTIKPTLFEFNGESVFISQDILSFRVNENIVDKAYLINELHADYVLKQLDSYRNSVASIPFIRRGDLMDVVIKLPSLQEQIAKVQGIYEISGKIKSLQEERNALVHGKSEKQFSEFASLKHTLGRPRQNILDWSDNLLDFLNKKKLGFEALNTSFKDFYDIDIISALKEIKRDVNFITDVLEKGENGLVLSEYEKQVISLSEINNIINELSANGFNFKIKKLLLKGDKLKERGIVANSTLLKTLLDNLLTNANKYAFDKKANGNDVVIELVEVEDILHMEIRNNGKPFPKNFDREKFITKYSTADSTNGSGLGGYDIHRIACDFNNPDWILSLNEDPFFLVKFKFQFAIKIFN